MLKDILSKFGIAGELLTFFWERKLIWMIPLVFILIFFGLLIVFGSATGVGPFIYTMF